VEKGCKAHYKSWNQLSVCGGEGTFTKGRCFHYFTFISSQSSTAEVDAFESLYFLFFFLLKLLVLKFLVGESYGRFLGGHIFP
jgi:hypothetical protein